MIPDDISLPLGPHARASRSSRIQALKEYGINPSILEQDIQTKNHTIAHMARMRRERAISGDINFV